ncbi:abortive infection family protein [Periweissella fabalis]|uniref:Abortive infection family protein n=1 Tax=Periweissella fabalis TaxID=1070421 RepID=A0A7X6S1V5_9LACO|nr:abortive infection family protein [Periweissella fabalis]MCM0599125.1 abortive infection family protein [Periweissella fabalis]NKZ23404.1 abortive infection family protein [Periweissella fabalis]
MDISPKYRIDLISKLEIALMNKYDLEYCEYYIRAYQEEIDSFGNVDFDIAYSKEKGHGFDIDIRETLKNIGLASPEKLVKIAIDMGIETPDFIPSIPMFKNKLKADYKNAATSFEKAFKHVQKDPGEAIGHANSVLESIMKEILKKTPDYEKDASRGTRKPLLKDTLNTFSMNGTENTIPQSIRDIANALENITRGIETTRSDLTLIHGQDSDKPLIKDPTYAYFIVNACATVGLFLINMYEDKQSKNTNQAEITDDDLPF